PLEQLERALEQLLLLERVAHLYGRALLRGGAAVLITGGELGRGQDGGTADPVASRGGAEQDDNVPHPGRRASHEPLTRREPERHRVHKAVVRKGRLEVPPAARRGHAGRVPVMGDTRHGPVEQVARTCALRARVGAGRGGPAARLAEAQ